MNKEDSYPVWGILLIAVGENPRCGKGNPDWREATERYIVICKILNARPQHQFEQGALHD
jgi:hypothetical protein